MHVVEKGNVLGVALPVIAPHHLVHVVEKGIVMGVASAVSADDPHYNQSS
jgi:hypothetical protein